MCEANHYIYNDYINNILDKLKSENCIRFDIKEINSILDINIEFFEPVWYKNVDENTKINVIEKMNNHYKNIKIHMYITNNNNTYFYC
tara:strand:- start:2705 stop:2968 length:264 start_codon:yes stop_codon:yes gene_type:complete